MSELASAPAQAPKGMLCPVCKVDLTMSDRQGIEIDYCPQCRGVWLDRGELDKLIERSAAYDAGQGGPGGPYPPGKPGAGSAPWGGREYDDDDDDDDRRYGGQRRGRRGFLGGLFDD